MVNSFAGLSGYHANWIGVWYSVIPRLTVTGKLLRSKVPNLTTFPSVHATPMRVREPTV